MVRAEALYARDFRLYLQGLRVPSEKRMGGGGRKEG
jgi:hypothetical protein